MTNDDAGRFDGPDTQEEAMSSDSASATELRPSTVNEAECGCGHPNWYHQKEGRCGWNGNSVRCNCEEFRSLTGYATLQMSGGGIRDGVSYGPPIHLVREVKRGTPGPTLCGIDRFVKGGPGWSVRGGHTGDYKPCEECDRARHRNLPVDGMFASLFGGPA